MCKKKNIDVFCGGLVSTDFTHILQGFFIGIGTTVGLSQWMNARGTGKDMFTGGELRNGVNGFLTSYATDSVRFLQQILDKEHAGTTNVFIRWQI